MVYGDSVILLAPWNESFPGVYTIESIEGNTAFLNGIDPAYSNAFDLSNLQVV